MTKRPDLPFKFAESEGALKKEPLEVVKTDGIPVHTVTDPETGKTKTGGFLARAYWNWLLNQVQQWFKWLDVSRYEFDIILGTQAQVVAGDATVWIDSSLANPAFKNVSGEIVTISENSKILVIGADLIQSGKILSFPVAVRIQMENPAASIKLNGQSCNFFGDVAGEVAFSGGGGVHFDKNSDGLKLRGNDITVTHGPSMTGNYFQNGVLKGKRLDIQFVKQPDLVILTASQLSNYSNAPNLVRVDQATREFKQRSGAVVVPDDRSEILIASLEQLTANLKFDQNHLRITQDKSCTIDLNGFFPILNGKNIKADFWFTDELQASPDGHDEDKRIVKIRNIGTVLSINGDKCTSGRMREEMHSGPVLNPYFLTMETGLKVYCEHEPGVNESVCVFPEAAVKWGHAAAPLGLATYLAQCPDISGRFIRYFGRLTVDPEVHQRTAPAGGGVLMVTSVNYTWTAGNEITITNETDFKRCLLMLGKRIRSSVGNVEIPDYNSGSPKTTIIDHSRIVPWNGSEGKIYLIDSETREDVTLSALTGNLLIDGAGNSLGSIYHDTLQGHEHEFLARTGVSNPYSSVITTNTNSLTLPTTGITSDGDHGVPRIGHQTTPVSVQYKMIMGL